MEARRLKRVVIKEEIFSVTGDTFEAIILGQFLYWQERVKDFDKFIEEEKKRMDMTDESCPFESTNGWMYKSAKELIDECLLTISEVTVRRYIQDLIKKNFLECRNNPLNKWDKTLQYRVRLDYLILCVKSKGYDGLSGYNLQNESTKLQNESTKLQNEEWNLQNEEAIPKITNIDYKQIREKEYSFKEEYSTKKVAETFENVENNKSVGTGYPVKTVSYVEKEKENVSPKEKESRSLGFRVEMRFNALVTGTPDCKISRIRGVRNNRLQSIKARIAEYGEDALYDAFKNAASSDFLNGRVSTDRGTFIATFDWIIRPNNFPKVLEGNYNNRHNSSDRSNISGHREKLRDAMSVYNTYNILGKERYNKFMAWLAKTCPYVYEYYHVLISCEEFYSMIGDIDKEQKFLNIICALGKNPEEMKAHDNLYEYVKSKMDV